MPAELEVNDVVLILRAFTPLLKIPPPLAVPVAELLVKAEVLRLIVPTDTLNSRTSSPPPPLDNDEAVLCVKVVPVIAKVPVAPLVPNGSPAE